MALGDATDSSGRTPNVSPSGSSSSGSSNDDEYPKQKEKVPFMAIFENQHGELEARNKPQNRFIVMEKKSEHSAWEQRFIPEEMERYWMTKQQYSIAVHMVDEQLGLDLTELIRNEPEKALRAITRAAKMKPKPSKPSPTERCPVCGDENHIVLGDWTRINGRRVCEHHTAQEITESGFL